MAVSIQEFDVLVAGGGLVGSVFAALLAQQSETANLRIGLVERERFDAGAVKQLFDPRVVALTEASRRVLAQAGVWSDDVVSRACPYFHMEVRDGEGTGLIEFDCAEVRQPNLGHIVENSVVVAAAERQLEDLENVEFIYQTITQLSHSEEDRTATLSLGNGCQISAPLLVAADGAHSFIRERSGFELRAWDYGHSAIITNIRTERPHGNTAYQWFTTHGPLAFLPLSTTQGEIHFSSIVWSQQHEVAKTLMELGMPEFMVKLGRASEYRLGDVVEISERFCVPLHQRHAVDYVKPGVVLIGDAAHTIHPLAGQGVNLGFADVAALVEEIVRGLKRNLPVGEASTLARYQRRRKPENLAMMVAMEGFKRFFAEDNPVLRILRNRGMSGLNEFGPLKNQLIRRAMGF